MSMFHSKDGLYFEQQHNGGVKILKKANAKPDAHIIFDITLDKDIWASIIASMSYYGEEDYGFYRATNFHSGEPIHDTTPIKEKQRKWS